MTNENLFKHNSYLFIDLSSHISTDKIGFCAMNLNKNS